MGGSGKAIAPAICVGQVDPSAELGSKRCLTNGALIIADDSSYWMLCFMCSDLVHCDFDKAVSDVGALCDTFIVMVACVCRGL